MFKSNKVDNTGIVEFNIAGKIDTKGMRKFRKLLKRELVNGRKVKLLGAFNKIPGFKSFKALRETMKMKLLALNALSKYAILTNRKWVENVIELADRLMPSIPMKAFRADQRGEAEKWLLS